ncbi:ATP-binding cassette domain-containing protein [Streptomyces sp. NPDC048277]|uniref:ATP-binding cassette domain-containing protein n=1 Tax=Streptomyces sp. NPDC048277 TaxID=3155027 RepID=UPI0033C5B243
MTTTTTTTHPLIELRDVTKRFTGVTAVADVSLTVRAGEVLCLLGHNGAGKSTLIKILSGVYAPTEGTMLIDGEPAALGGPRDALDRGIATVHQGAGTVPLMSVARNFFLGAEPTKGRGPFRRYDAATAGQIALREIQELGIRRIRDADQLVGTMSGGERQALVIARALHFGARVLILDEPTSALGVREAETVLQAVEKARDRGIGVVLITHQAHHALRVGDHFAVIAHGRLAASFGRGEKEPAEVIDLMAGGTAMEELERQQT